MNCCNKVLYEHCDANTECQTFNQGLRDLAPRNHSTGATCQHVGNGSWAKLGSVSGFPTRPWPSGTAQMLGSVMTHKGCPWWGEGRAGVEDHGGEGASSSSSQAENHLPTRELIGLSRTSSQLSARAEDAHSHLQLRVPGASCRAAGLQGEGLGHDAKLV